MLAAAIWIKPALIAGAAGLVLGLGLGAYGVHEFYAPRLELAEAKVQALGDRIDEQNAAIEAAQAADKARAAAARQAIAKAQREAEQAQHAAMDILTRQPAPGVDRCTAASALVREELAK